ncbi:MAG: NADH-quinone oxidoreductase subunit H [Bacteriovoracaceae bacterium]|nr:NADH-quinone oxidoreductase subunit H [Bacteriovoracaceae bacterium]
MNQVTLFFAKMTGAALWPFLLMALSTALEAHLLKAIGPRWAPLKTRPRHHFLMVLKQFGQRPGAGAWRPSFRVRWGLILIWAVAFLPWAFFVFGSSQTLEAQEVMPGIYLSRDNALLMLVFMFCFPFSLLILRPHIPSLAGQQSALRFLYHLMAADFPLLFCLLAIFSAHHTFELGAIALAQEVHWPDQLWNWNVWRQPLGAITFLGLMRLKMHQAPFNQIINYAEVGLGPGQDLGQSKFYFLRLAWRGHIMLWPLLFVFFYLGGFGLLPGLDLFDVGPYGQWALENLSLLVKVALVLYFLHWTNYLLPSLKNEDVVAWGIKYFFPLAILNWFWVMAQGFWQR